MQSLSQTLRDLHIDNASPWVADNDTQNFNIRHTSNRVSMPALQHIEVKATVHEPYEGSPLLFLHNLSVPNIVTITWDHSRLTEGFHDFNPSSNLSLGRIPPVEHFTRVTNLIATTSHKHCHVLTGTTLLVNFYHVPVSGMKQWLTFLPNLYRLALVIDETYAR